MRTEIEGEFTRHYIYSHQGIEGYEENGERFIYRKNIFGDITAIYKGATKVAEYAYDAWGNCTITYDSDGYGASNPFRYRGYYWDEDLKMYYLMTRYYDPKTGRFINADTPDYLDPETLGGLNLYSYCNNNPVMDIDPFGNWSIRGSWETVKKFVMDKIVSPISKLVKNIKDDIEAFDKNNTEPSKVKQANYFSCYRGTIVVILPGNNIGFSFGAIFVTDDYSGDADVLNHEFGHKCQLDNMGAWDYFFEVALPSATYWWVIEITKKKPYDYYGSPWESEADKLGGVTRTSDNTPWPKEECDSYWDIFKLFFK